MEARLTYLQHSCMKCKNRKRKKTTPAHETKSLMYVIGKFTPAIDDVKMLTQYFLKTRKMKIEEEVRRKREEREDI